MTSPMMNTMGAAANRQVRPAERRQFGRRQTCLHAWIEGRTLPRIPCIVRNLSLGGALLETEWSDRLPNRFELFIETMNFTSVCEVRHRSENGVGVYFVLQQHDAAGPISPSRNL